MSRNETNFDLLNRNKTDWKINKSPKTEYNRAVITRDDVLWDDNAVSWGDMFCTWDGKYKKVISSKSSKYKYLNI